MSRKLVFLLLCACTSALLHATPRDAEWQQVAQAIHNDQPKTAIGLLKPLESAAFTAGAWGEGAKAMAMRFSLERKTNSDALLAITGLADEIPGAPIAARPVLRLLYARWLAAYYDHHRWWVAERTPTAAANDEMWTGDAPRLLQAANVIAGGMDAV